MFATVLQIIWRICLKTQEITKTHKVIIFQNMCCTLTSGHQWNIKHCHKFMHVLHFYPLSCPCYCEGSGQSCKWYYETRGETQQQIQQLFKSWLFFSINASDVLIMLTTLCMWQDNFQKLIQVQCSLNGQHEIVQPGRVRLQRFGSRQRKL